MKSSALAKRYARAFIGFAGSNTDARKLSSSLNNFVQAMQISDDLGKVFANPSFAAFRIDLIKALARPLMLSDTAERTISYLIEKDRIKYLEDIVLTMNAILDERTGKQRATITSAVELPEDRYQRIRAALERITGKLIVLEKELDPLLIGGVVATVGSLVYDGSIVSQLRSFSTSTGKES